jgi:hypothetical protein
MRWSDLPLNPSPRTLRQFAALWILFFGGLAAWHWFGRDNHNTGVGLALLAVTVGPLGLVAPALIRPVFITWLVLGFPIGWTISRLMLLTLFFGVMLPVGLLFRLRGRDALHLARTEHGSRWMPKPVPSDPASYFRPY